MNSKTMAYLAAFIGSIVGGFIPTLWGAGFLSITSLIFSSIGAIIGIIVVVKLL
jgi:uncharacterized membrane protein YeaQ/YmgE (transglycosylase-associated protein family)